MEYTVKQLAALAGISPRTLRYYDSIGLLHPDRVTAAGYRIYTGAEVDRLQQILFYKALDFELEQIAQILSDPNYDALAALKRQRQGLLAKREVLDRRIANITKTIATKEGKGKMQDSEKFSGFVEKAIADNEANYGSEIREKYGEDAVAQSYGALRKMSAGEYESFKALENQIITTLKALLKDGDAETEAGKKLAEDHARWLRMAWGHYDKAAHRGVTAMYLCDPRFTAYYDERAGQGAAALLADCVNRWIK